MYGLFRIKKRVCGLRNSAITVYTNTRRKHWLQKLKENQPLLGSQLHIVVNFKYFKVQINYIRNWKFIYKKIIGKLSMTYIIFL